MTVHTCRRDLSALQGLEKFYISMYSSLSRYVVDPQGFSGRNDLVRDWRCKRRLLYIYIHTGLRAWDYYLSLVPISLCTATYGTSAFLTILFL
jgi:hypothetical protein